MKNVKSTEPATYTVTPINDNDAVIQKALVVLSERIKAHRGAVKINSPGAIRDYLKLRLANKQREHFLVIPLDNQHCLLDVPSWTLFSGTIDGCTVYPREVAKFLLGCNAAACFLVHNHPSGEPQPSGADRGLTKKLQAALGLFDIRILDHIIVAGDEMTSFAERGLL